MSYERPRFLAAGDRAILVEFGNTISLEIGRQVRRFMLATQAAQLPGLVEIVPAYRSLLIYYDPLQISAPELRQKLRTIEQEPQKDELPQPTVTEIPTVYGNQYGPDLEFVAKHNSITPEEVVRLHKSAVYLIYMVGFMAGFAYLGGMSPRIATPRLETPRSRIPAGSVGIAGSQTGVYPAESPGGWRIIGRTPVNLFDPLKEPPALLVAGNYVKFVEITAQEFVRIEEEVQQAKTKLKTLLKAAHK